MRYHGNYCGPNWSAGKYQQSVDSDVPALDEFDETCKEHDRAYALGMPLRRADLKFAYENLSSMNPKRMLAGMLVGAQGLMRPVDSLSTHITNTETIMAKPKPNKFNKAKSAASSTPTMRRGAPGGNNTTKAGNDITRAAPVAMSTRRTGAAPIMRSRSNGVSITHRTFLGPVIPAASSYLATGYPVNPGLADTFPWLSKVASRYDKYRFTSLRFEYRSVCATSTSGVVMMSFDYNAADPIPVNKQIQAQTIPNAENNVWVNNDLIVPTDNEWRFVRQGLVTGTDIKTYDLGNMCLSTVYTTAASAVGELYVEYTVELEYPSEPEAIASMIYTASPTPSAPLTGAIILTGLPSWAVQTNSRLICTVPGTWLMSMQPSGAAISALIAPAVITGSVLITTLQSAVINAASSSAQLTVTVRAQRGDVITFASSITAVSLTYFTIAIAEYTT